MSKEIRTLLWCDGPAHEGAEAPEATITRRFSIDNLRDRELDLCEQCDKELTATLLDLLNDVGQPVRRSSSSASSTTSGGEFVCDVDGCGKAVPTAQGLGTHKSRVHGIVGVNSKKLRQSRTA